MLKLLPIVVIASALIACERSDKVRSDKAMNTPSTEQVDHRNTEKNVRDRDSRAQTSFNQSEDQLDRNITAEIRQIIMNDDVLSTNAKNIKVISVDGVVTLRGPVDTLQEREIILKKINNVRGIKNINNQLEVVKANNAGF